MKELVTQIIEDATKKGFRSTRMKPGPKHIPGSTLLEPLVLDHDPDYFDQRQRCQRILPGSGKKCGKLTGWCCPGCAALDDCGPASGFYCRDKERNCMKLNHAKRCRTRAPTAEEDDE